MESIENGFTVTPMNQKISLSPGETYRGSITISVPSNATTDFSYKVSITPYGVIGEDYTADLQSESNRTTITKWIKITEPTGIVKQNEPKELEFTITVPKDAPAGGQYATIAVSSNSDSSDDKGVSIQSVYEIASVIYADIAGETNHDGEVLENNVPSFVLVKPVTLSALLTNSGNVHETAYITITASDFFTGKVIIPSEESAGVYSEVIMPETTRHTEHELSNLPEIGIVKVTQSINYNGQISTEEKDIIICPIWFMALLGFVIASIITSIVVLFKKRRLKRAAAE